jgi:DNA-binding winged helix-turn-helix (wHTH) protein
MSVSWSFAPIHVRSLKELPKDFETPAMNVQFGEFLMDSDARQLSRAGRDIKLSPKAFDLLCALLVRRPDVLSKNDLLAAIWPDTFVVEANLNVVIGEIRRALGDDRQAPRFIRTVHGVGYAFCGQAVDVADGARAAAAAANCWLSWKDRSFALSAGDNIIGRDPRSTIWLDDESVSRRHAVISVEHDVARVNDLRSTNGTFLNRAPLESPTVLQDGDIVRVGSLKLTFRTVSDTAARTRRLRRGSETGGSKPRS